MFLLAAILNLALVGLTIGAPVIVAKHLGMQSSFVGIIEVAMGLGGLVWQRFGRYLAASFFLQGHMSICCDDLFWSRTDYCHATERS